MKKLFPILLMAMMVIVLSAATVVASSCDELDPDEAKQVRIVMNNMTGSQVDAVSTDPLSEKEVLALRVALQRLGRIPVYTEKDEQENPELNCAENAATRVRLQQIQAKINEREILRQAAEIRKRRGHRNQDKPASSAVVRRESSGMPIPEVADDALARTQAKLALDTQRLEALRRQQAVQAELNRRQSQGSGYYVPAANQGRDASYIPPAQPRQPAQPQEPSEPSDQGSGDDAPLVQWDDTFNVIFNVNDPEAGTYMKEEGEVIVDPEYKPEEDEDRTVYRRTYNRELRFGRE